MSEASARPSWLRPEVQLLAAVLTLVGGGFTSHVSLSSNLGSKIEKQGDTLDAIKTGVVELKEQVKAIERSSAELALNHAALVGRVNLLETRDATHSERLADLQRRVHDLETRPK